MSHLFTLSANDSVLSARINPPIILNENNYYSLAFIDFASYNSIPNVDSSNNMFFYGDHEELELPEGSYEIQDIEKYILENVNQKENDKLILSMKANNNTLKSVIKCNKDIDFGVGKNLGKLLGFKPQILKKDVRHTSDYPINISNVNSICIECNLVTNSYNNERPVHILHAFYPTVPPGFKIVECPSNVIYLPINTKRIDEIIVKITDQDGKLINFRKELITVRLHLKIVS